MSHEKINAYHVMWILVFFDLPVITKTERKQATQFRNNLLKDGFSMLQYSVYIRHCASLQNTTVHVKHVKQTVPPKGKVSILLITDKQYGDIITYHGSKIKDNPKIPRQLELF